MSPGFSDRARRAAPFLVALAWLSLGYANLVRGVAHPGVEYRPWAFRSHSYSDILALSGDRYLGGGRPVPYLEDPIEYPVVLGLALFLPALLPGGQWAHFTASVLFLAFCLAAAIEVLRRMPGASPWWLAGTPALAYYGALNWDLLPVALLLGALFAHERGWPGRSGSLAALGASAKLWPLALLPPVAADLGREGRLGGLARFGLAFAGVTLAANLPFALLAPANWAHFFSFNAGRAAENSVWEVFRLRDPAALNALTFALLAAAVALAARGARNARPGCRTRAVRLGTALVLVAWVATNKVWSPQYALYAFAAGALVAAPAWLFAALAVVSVVDYHLAFEVRAERGVFWFFDGWYYGEEMVRTAVYGTFVAFLLRELRRTRVGAAGATS